MTRALASGSIQTYSASMVIPTYRRPGPMVEGIRSLLPSTRLDDFIGTDPAPDVVKIDVEGAELAVLHGADATLRKARPKLLIEIHGWGSPESVKVSEYLSSFGYKRTILGSRGSEVFAFFRPGDQASGIVP